MSLNNSALPTCFAFYCKLAQSVSYNHEDQINKNLFPIDDRHAHIMKKNFNWFKKHTPAVNRKRCIKSLYPVVSD